MAPSVNGRFCTHCQKEVYDLTYGKTLPDTSDNFCGRINVESSTKEISFKKLVWKQNPVKYILFTSLLLFTRNIKAQIVHKNAANNPNSNKNQGNVIIKTITISGVLTDEKTKQVISSANIKAYDNLNNFLGMATTDVNGAYALKFDKINIKGKSIRLLAMYNDYDPINITDIPIHSKKQNIKIHLSEISMMTGDIMVPESENQKK